MGDAIPSTSSVVPPGEKTPLVRGEGDGREEKRDRLALGDWLASALGDGFGAGAVLAWPLEALGPDLLLKGEAGITIVGMKGRFGNVNESKRRWMHNSGTWHGVERVIFVSWS